LIFENATVKTQKTGAQMQRNVHRQQKEIKMFANRLFVLSMAIVLLISACAPSETKSSASLQQWHTADVLQAFQAAGLPVEIPQLSKDERDLFSNEMVLESTQFVIPAQDDSTLASGIIFSFQNERDLREIQNYYAGLGKAMPQYESWIFIKDNLLLQINRDIPEAVAKQYAEVLYLLGD
jgi:hypothetical protein